MTFQGHDISLGDWGNPTNSVDAPRVNCTVCGKLFDRTHSDIRHRKRKCKKCRSSVQREQRRRLIARRKDERRSLVARIDNMRAELVRLTSILSTCPSEVRAAYLLEKDHAGAVIRAVRERDELYERVRQLEGSFRGDEWIPDEWGLTGKESQLLAALVNRSPASKEYLFTVLYGLEPNGGPDPKILDVMIHKMRVKLDPHQITIETNWGTGYSLGREALEMCRCLKKKRGR
jgi:hypothetical protein